MLARPLVSHRAPRGMTLIEIMVVIAIIGMMATLVAVNVAGRMAEARIKTAKSDVEKIANEGVEAYKINKGHYPSTEEGLQVLIQEKLLKPNTSDGKLKDPWGHEYIYMNPGQKHTDGFDVMSYGADGQQGGEGENADVVNQ